MLNHHRGLWGYSGPAADGSPLTIQSTGLGGPSAAAVVAELIGARRAPARARRHGAGWAGRRSGRSSPWRPRRCDGTSRALGAGARVAADPALTPRWRPAPVSLRGLVASADIHDPVLARGVGRRGRVRVDLATAAVLAAAARRGRRGGAVAVTRAGGKRLDGDALEQLEAALGAVAFAALRRPPA